MNSCHVIVSGRVQGVFYRASTQMRARELGIVGWVRNRRDGRVEAHLEGDDDAVKAMLGWMREGPEAAVVEDMAVTPVGVEGWQAFEVR